jgi:hypothetical protein
MRSGSKSVRSPQICYRAEPTAALTMSKNKPASKLAPSKIHSKTPKIDPQHIEAYILSLGLGAGGGKGACAAYCH